MAWIIIGAIIVILVFLIFFLPYGIDASYEAGVFRLKVKAGPLRITILPKKPKTEAQLERARLKKEKKEAKKAAKAEKKAAEAATEASPPEKPRKKPDIEFLWALAQMGVRAIRRFFRSFSIDYFHLRFIAGGTDPYTTSQLYSYACGAVEAIPVLAGNKIRLRKKDIEIGCDFLAEAPLVEGGIVISLQLFRIVHLAVAFGVEFINWKIKHCPDKGEHTDERMDNNGRE